MAEAYGVGEIVVVTITYDFAARLRSYELLADVFGLAQCAASEAREDAVDAGRR